MATLFWSAQKLAVSHVLINRTPLIYSHAINMAKFLWPVGDWINGVLLYYH